MFKSRILDTLVFKDSNIQLLDYHIDRTYEAYRFLNLPVDKTTIVSIYAETQKNYAAQVKQDECLRLIFSDFLPIEHRTEVQKLKVLSDIIRLKTYQLQKHPDNFFKFKWENRQHWDDLMLSTKDPSIDDLLLINPSGQLTETTRFNVFVYSSQAHMCYTPELSSGCMNGTYRRFALAHKQIELPDRGLVQLIEKNILLNESDNFEIYVANSVRGVLKTELLRNY